LAKYKHKQDIKRSPIRQSRTSKRILIKKKGVIPENAKYGTVIAAIGKVVIVKPEELDFNYDNFVTCYIAGTIITKNEFSSIIAVGDKVHFLLFSEIDKETGLKKGSIVAVEERKTMIARKTPGKEVSENIIASNIDNLLIFMSAFDPLYNKRLIDRYLIAAEAGGVKPAICINKMDLVEDFDFFTEDLQVYSELGIDVIFISAQNNVNIDTIISYINGKSTLFSGVSGSGKSTLINTIFGKEIQAVSEISEKTLKGKHKTTSVKMFQSEKDTYIIDSPGIREFGIIGIDKNEISLYFHDFDNFFPECKYSSCNHIHEPGCAVRDAVESGLIDYERYQSYVNIFESIS
jgi:ribosome biogenesis GTPase